MLNQSIARSFLKRVNLRKNKKLPLIAGHKLLFSCNLRCLMCPFWRIKDEKLLTLEEEILVLESLRRAGVCFLGFEGGEPLMRSDIPEILRESYVRFHTSLVTNGWLLKNKIKEIKDYLDYLFVSIDGIGSLHDKLRGIPGSFERVIEGIKAAKKYLPVSISYTITKDNYYQAVDLVKLSKKLAIGINVQIAYTYSTAEPMAPGKKELYETLIVLLQMKKKGYPIVNTKGYFEAIINSWYRGIRWRCKPWLTINIDPQGRIVMPCYVLNEYSGSYKAWQIDIVELWNKYDWSRLENCNKCALACYLEPSLFNWFNFSIVKERIIDNIVEFIRSKFN